MGVWEQLELIQLIVASISFGKSCRIQHCHGNFEEMWYLWCLHARIRLPKKYAVEMGSFN